MVDRKVNIILSAKNRASRVLDRLRNKFRALGRAAASVKGVIVGALGTAALIRSVQGSIRAISQQITAERKLEGVLRATGAAAGFNAEQLKRRAAELQEATTFGDENIINLQSQLATFGKISDANFSRATEAAINMATVFDTRLRLAGRQLGQSLAEPELALTRLRRMGVVFTQDQEKLIETLVESGRTAEAQDVILTKLENTFGGVAQSIAQGPVGSIEQSKNAIGDFVEEIGAAFAPMVATILKGIRRIAEAIGPFLTSTIKSFSRFFLRALGLVSEGILAWQQAGVTAVAAVNFAFDNSQRLISVAMDSALLAVVTFQNQITHVFTEIIPETLDWFLGNWKDIFNTIWDFTRTLITNLAENIVEVITNLPALLRGDMDLSDVWTPITEGFKSSIRELPEFADREVGALEKKLRDKVTESGGKLGQGFQDELNKRIGAVGAEGTLPDILRRASEEGLAALQAGAFPPLPESPGGDGSDGAAGGGGGRSQATGGAPDRSPISSPQLGRQFRGIAARFEAGRSLGGKTSEEATADNTKKLVRESEKQREAIEKLAQLLRQGGIQTLRTSLS